MPASVSSTGLGSRPRFAIRRSSALSSSATTSASWRVARCGRQYTSVRGWASMPGVMESRTGWPLRLIFARTFAATPLMPVASTTPTTGGTGRGRRIRSTCTPSSYGSGSTPPITLLRAATSAVSFPTVTRAPITPSGTVPWITAWSGSWGETRQCAPPRLGCSTHWAPVGVPGEMADADAVRGRASPRAKPDDRHDSEVNGAVAAPEARPVLHDRVDRRAPLFAHGGQRCLGNRTPIPGRAAQRRDRFEQLGRDAPRAVVRVRSRNLDPHGGARGNVQLRLVDVVEHARAHRPVARAQAHAADAVRDDADDQALRRAGECAAGAHLRDREAAEPGAGGDQAYAGTVV